MKSLSFIFTLIVFIGCGGGGGDSSSSGSTVSIQKATFLDAKVIGARYDAGGGITGITDSDGVFRYREGHAVKFYVGDVFLGEGLPVTKANDINVTTEKIVSPLELANANGDINNLKALKLVRFLMSLDTDNTPNNGISVESSRVVGYSLSLLEEAVTLESSFGNQLTLPTFSEARKHLCTSLELSDCSQAFSISGIPKTTTNIYSIYQFLPKVSNIGNVTFTIQNKPSWAEFNTTTGLLEGIPSLSDEGNYTNIIISVTDGIETVSLDSFSIEVNSAINIAQKFGKATQGAIYGGDVASRAIDGDLLTWNHTQCNATDNWWQVELPNPTKISKLIINNRIGQQARLNNAKVYFSNTTYAGAIELSSEIETLNSDNIQTFAYETVKEGRYLLIKADGGNCLHTPEVEVYGETPKEPKILENSYQTTIHRWHNKVESILTVGAVDYQDDMLTYTILDNVPFVVDSDGKLRVNAPLPEESYSFTLKVSDGINEVQTTVTIDINTTAKANSHIYTTDSTPALSAYLPNTYTDGDSVTITINGVDYTPTIDVNGTWSIVDDTISPRLDIRDYNISIVINNDAPIVYENFFAVYGASENKKILDLIPTNNFEEIQVSVTSSSSAPLPRGKRVRATSIYLRDNGTKIVNDSYRKLKSLIVYHEDGSGLHFKKLVLDQEIEPYSENDISSFTDSDKMKIYTTANQYTKEIQFSTKICTDATSDTTVYCSPTNRDETPYSDKAVQNPTLSEQQVFTQVEATWHHIYNRVDGIKSIDAWIDRKVYKDMDFTTDYQSSDDYATGEAKREFFTKKFFASFLPNNSSDFYAMRYQYAAEGMAGLPNSVASSTGEYGVGSWASLWEGSIRLGKEDNGDFRLSPFEYIHHESMHSLGMGHETGLSYGWPNQARKIFIKKYYTLEGEDSAIFPKVKAPKYIFSSKALSPNSLELTLYKDTGANSNSFTFEAFYGNGSRADDFVFETIDDNHVKLTFDETIFPRFFVRLYGEDSDEFMSQLITPYNVYKNDLLEVVDNEKNQTYIIVPHTLWKTLADKAAIEFKISAGYKVCKMLTDTQGGIITGEDANSQLVKDAIVGANLTDTDKFYATHYGDTTYPWWKYSTYDSSTGEVSYHAFQNGYSNIITEEKIGTICVRAND